MVRATLIGDKALIAKFEAANASIEALKPVWIAQCGNIVRESIVENLNIQGLDSSNEPYRDDPRHEPGALKKSGRTFFQTKNGINVGFGKDLPYAQAIEHGSIPHDIWVGPTTTGDTNLAFWWEREGFFFIGPHVLHPGNRPYKFVYQGTMAAVTPILLYWQSFLRAVFKVPL